MRIFDTFMFRNELDVLQMRLEALAHDSRVRHVLVETTQTHRGFAKPLVFLENRERFREWLPRIIHVVATDLTGSPWQIEHKQRDAAWPEIDARGKNGDIVFICDVDEIPGQAMLNWNGDQVISVPMRTCIFAVDWEVAQAIPPTCVMASVGYLRDARERWHEGLGEVRDGRDRWGQLGENGGWHLSWLGGPEAQREKLETATCHEEMLRTPEAPLIASGVRWATQENGGGLPVRPVDVDSAWPAYVYQRRCPQIWFRPREQQP